MRRIVAMFWFIVPLVFLSKATPESTYQGLAFLDIAPCHVIVSSAGGVLPSGLALSSNGALYVAYSSIGPPGSRSRIALYDQATIAKEDPLARPPKGAGFNYGVRPVQPKRYIDSVELGHSAYAIALDREGNLYVADPSLRQGMIDTGSDAAIRVFAPNASGLAEPARIVRGPHTHLRHPRGLAVDAAGNVYVADGNSVIVFAADANDDEAPVREIKGPHTKLNAAHAVAVGPDGTLFVSGGPYLGDTTTPYFINAYTGRAQDDQRPTRQIAGEERTPNDFNNAYQRSEKWLKENHLEHVMVPDPSTSFRFEPRNNPKLNHPMQMAVDTKGNLWVANQGIFRVTEYAPGAFGNVAPIRIIEGDKTGLSQPSGLAVDRVGNVYVSNWFGVTEYCLGD